MMDPKKKIYISIFLTSVITLALLVGVAFPLIGWISDDSTELSEVEAEIISMEKAQSETESFQRFLNERGDVHSRLNDILIDPDPPVEFIRFLEGLADDSELDMVINPRGDVVEEAGDAWPSMKFELVLDGDYEGTRRFISMLENAPYLVDISNFTMDGVERQDPATVMSIKVYTQ